MLNSGKLLLNLVFTSVCLSLILNTKGSLSQLSDTCPPHPFRLPNLPSPGNGNYTITQLRCIYRLPLNKKIKVITLYYKVTDGVRERTPFGTMECAYDISKVLYPSRVKTVPFSIIPIWNENEIYWERCKRHHVDTSTAKILYILKTSGDVRLEPEVIAD